MTAAASAERRGTERAVPRAETSGRRTASSRKTDLDVLRAHHRFLHDDREEVSYEAQVARKYYDALFKEYAIANLKHYRTRGIALRWRTEDEVVDGIGQDSCANQRCADHYEVDAPPPLGEFEVPFAYEEPDADGRMIAKQALVKVVLCDPCAEKLQHASRHARAAHDTPEAARAARYDAHRRRRTRRRSASPSDDS